MLRDLMVAVLVLLAPSLASAIDVAEAVMTTAVVEREAVDQVEVFTRQSGKLFCFTHLVDAAAPTVVYHLWYRGDELVSLVSLPVEAPSWRTWSAKHLLDDQPGAWRVVVQDADRRLIRELGFELR